MARADVHVYSFKNVICAIGSHMPSGFAGDNCITITPQGDGITDEAGADGEVVVSNSDDPRYEVKMILSMVPSQTQFCVSSTTCKSSPLEAISSR